MTEATMGPPSYATGDAVRVALTWPPGHRRIPQYIRGKAGVIERYCGTFRNPEELAYGFDGLPERHLYRVRFKQAHVWKGYDGHPDDTIDLEIQEHWLSPAEGDV